MNKYLECGVISNTHGIDGSVKALSWCDSPEVLASLPSVYTEQLGVYVELECDKKYEIYNIYGELYAQGTLNAGIHLINAKNCERVSLI